MTSGGGGAATAGTGGTTIAGSASVAGGGSGGSSGGAAGGSTGGSGGGSSCSLDPAGKLVVVGDVVVHDPKTCLDWAKTTTAGVNYAAAQTACGDSTLGGFDDWRIPNVHELASIITACGTYPPDGPVDKTVFDIQGDGYWTTTPAEGTVNNEGQPTHLCAVGMANAGGYYKYGPAGPQVVRCVRGAGTVKMVKDCTDTTVNGCKNW
jgi:hypothetical protein